MWCFLSPSTLTQRSCGADQIENQIEIHASVCGLGRPTPRVSGGRYWVLDRISCGSVDELVMKKAEKLRVRRIGAY
jgi:hypothetical protein